MYPAQQPSANIHHGYLVCVIVDDPTKIDAETIRLRLEDGPHFMEGIERVEATYMGVVNIEGPETIGPHTV